MGLLLVCNLIIKAQPTSEFVSKTLLMFNMTTLELKKSSQMHKSPSLSIKIPMS